MAKYPSEDLRIRVIRAVEGGMSRSAAAKRFGVSIASAVRWMDTHLRTGRTAPKPRGGDRRSGRIEAQAELLIGAVEETPDITLAELRERPIQVRGESFAISSIHDFCRRHGIASSMIARKRRRMVSHWNAIGPSDNGQRAAPGGCESTAEAWFEAQPEFDPARLVFIDETGASTKMARRRGRSRRAERCRAAVPHGHWKATTLVAGLRLGGLSAPMIIDGAMNGDAFAAYAERLLAPTLAPGDIVVVDNLSAHEVEPARAAIERARRWSSCRPAPRTSTRLSRPWRSLKRFSERQPLARSMRSKPPSRKPWSPSPPPSAPTTSPTQAASPD